MGQATIINALFSVLRPLVRILLRNGVPVDVFEDIARRVYVEVADRDFALAGRKQSVSRIGVLTGLNRKEVSRLRNLPQTDGEQAGQRHNRAERVLTAWLREPEYLDEKGDPQLLPFEGENSFTMLVRRFSGDMPARAVADELIRVGSVERQDDGSMRLKSRGYVPGSGDEQSIVIFGVHAADLLGTFDRNLSGDPDPLWQRQVIYNDIPLHMAGEFRKLSSRWGQRMLEELDRWLSERNVDDPNDPEPTVRMGFGLYQIESESDPLEKPGNNRQETSS